MPEMNPETPMEAVKINDKTYRIEDNGVRCYLFIGTKQALLVDTGFGQSGNLKELVETLTDKPIKLIISHADPDHIGNIEIFDKVHMHKTEVPYFLTSDNRNIEIVEITEDDKIDIGDRQFEIMHIPGHTTGSIALLDRENRIIVTGDSLSAGPVFMFGEGRDINAYMASMERLDAIKETFDEIYPSHGPSPLYPDHIQKAITAAKKLLADELTPQDPPFPLPAKMYIHDGTGFFY